MHEKDLDVCLLLDFYGDLLAEKQQAILDCYYNEDLSLSEIAEIYSISRQGVLAAIKKGRLELFEYEKKLGLKKKFGLSGELWAKAKGHIDALLALNSGNSESETHLHCLMEIVDMLGERR